MLQLENAEDPPVSLRLRQFDDLDLAGGAVRLGGDCPIGRGRLSWLFPGWLSLFAENGGTGVTSLISLGKLRLQIAGFVTAVFAAESTL
jgi:hypothetical protein